jgi:hypothetical protein
MASPNSTYSEALSATIANYSKGFADNLTENIALLNFIKKNDNIQLVYDGGTEILQQLSYSGELTANWYEGMDTLNVDRQESMTSASFPIRQAYTHVTFSGKDEMIHTGKANIHDFFKVKIGNAKAELTNIIGAALFYSNTEASGKAIGGLQHLVSDTGTGTVGNIDASTSDWWKNYTYSFTSKSATASSSTIIPAMNDVYAKTTVGGSSPDLVVAGFTYYNHFESALQEKQYFANADQANKGFSGYRYKNAVVTLDPHCGDTRMYMLNTRFIHFRPHEKRNFVTGKSKESVNQDAYVIPIYWGGNMTISGRRNHGVITA